MGVNKLFMVLGFVFESEGYWFLGKIASGWLA